MKQYNKPIFEFIEIRTEERLATCTISGSCPDTPENRAAGIFSLS